MSRTQKALYNIAASTFGNVLVIILKFVNRMILIHTLGSEYLGISGLFSSIFSILDLAELGIGSAITYAMYRPLAEKDYEKIKSLVNLYRKAYITIGLCILTVGILLFPFIPYIIKDTGNLVNIHVIYFMYLSQTVSSYCFFSYKSAILIADQKEYKLTILSTAMNVAAAVLQGLVLLVTGNYLLYLAVSIGSGILKNGLAAHMAEKLYPVISEKAVVPLAKEERKAIFDNIKGLAIYKVSSKVLTSTDNIIISTFIGIAMVGKYDNYNYFWMVFTGICMMLFNTYTPSIGNLYVTESKEKLEDFFHVLNFANFWIYGICAVGMYTLMSPIVALCFGKEYVLSDTIVLLIVLNFITAGLQNAVITYKDACGLFYKGRWRPVFSSISNLVISLILVQYYGIAGVVAGTIISRFLTTWWYDAWIVYRCLFGKSPLHYYLRYLYRFLCVGLACEIAKMEYLYLFSSVSIGGILLQIMFCLAISCAVFYVLNFWQKDFQSFLRMMKNLLQKSMEKIRKKL